MVQKKLPLINSAHGSETRNIINELIKLFNGMGYTYNDSLNLANNILKEAQRSNASNIDANKRLDNVLSSLTNDSEVIDSRNYFNTLGNRLNSLNDRVYSKSTLPPDKVKSIVTFYLDDGYDEDFDIVYPKAKSLGIPITICVINNSRLLLRRDDLDELLSNGWELHAHTNTHPHLNTLDYEEQVQEMRENIDFYRNLGYNLTSGICYPYGSRNLDTLRASREFFDCGMGSAQKVNKMPIDQYDIKRISTDNFTLSELKKFVDDAVSENNHWIVFYSHSKAFSTDSAKKQKFFDIMDYVAQSTLPTMTSKDALKYYGNALDIGESSFTNADFRIGGDGSFDSSILPLKASSDTSDILNRKGTDFDSGRLTIHQFYSNNRLDVPFDNGIGTLYTDRLYESARVFGADATQTFRGKSGITVYRTYGSSGWSDWITEGIINTVNNSYNNSTPIHDFPRNKITIIPILSSDNGGFPAVSGVLETYRLTNIVAVTYQTFQPFNNNNLYKRRWEVDNWGEWQLLTTTNKITGSLEIGTLAANETKVLDIMDSRSRHDSSININIQGSLINGVIAYSYPNGTGKISVKVTNFTDTSKNVGTRTYIITFN